MNSIAPFPVNARVLPIFIATVFASGCHASQATGLGPGRYVQHLKSGQFDRSFIVDVPRSYDSKTPMPVVVVLHGWTFTGALAEKYTAMQEEGESQGFIAVFPDGIGKAWNAGFLDLTGKGPDDVGFTNELLDHLEKELNVDKNREYVCGHSDGAFMANYLGAKLSSRLAAVGSVAGTIGVGDKRIPAPDSPISVILIHGKKDPTVAYSQSATALLKGIGAEDSAEWWAQQDGCSPTPTTSTNPEGNATTEIFGEGKGDVVVELISISNGTHVWPGGWLMEGSTPTRETSSKINAADLIWQFFKAHPKGGNP